MYGCELDDDGSTRGYRQYGYDGADFVSLDISTLTYTAANPQAVITKHKWEALAVPERNKAYLENTCIEWLKKYVAYGKDTLERKGRNMGCFDIHSIVSTHNNPQETEQYASKSLVICASHLHSLYKCSGTAFICFLENEGIAGSESHIGV